MISGGAQHCLVLALRGRRSELVTQSLKTTALMCTLTGNIAKLAILKHARIVLQKNNFNEKLQHVHKISTHHKKQSVPTGDTCTTWGREEAFQGVQNGL